MPRLTEITIVDLRTSETSALLLLMSPLLRTLSIFFALEADGEDRRNAPHVANALLQTLPLVAPNLESFYCHVDISVGHGYIEAFSQLARLKTLSISSKLTLDDDSLRTLLAVYSIQDLSCTIDLSDSALTLHPIMSQQLTRLDLEGPFDDLTEFMDACQRPNLVGIKFRITEPPINGDFADSLAAVCEHCNPALLTSFAIDTSYDLDFPLPNRVMEYLEPVLAFPNIKYFTLWLARAIPPIHDDDLAQFGAA